jgi:Tol biopolymer transport system component
LTDKNDEKAAQGGSDARTKGFGRLRELTDEQWKKIMKTAQEQEDAHDESERKAIQQAYQRRLVWVSRDGVEQFLAAPPRNYEAPRISPDARQVAVSVRGEIWLYDLSRETLTQLTHQGNKNESNRPVWTPDGKRIAFCSDTEGPQNIYWQLADGSGGLERLTTSESTNVPISVSPDGQTLAFHKLSYYTGMDVWIYEVWMLWLSDRKAQPFLRSKLWAATPRFSPDGRWLAFISDESGRYEVYVQPYPGPGDRVQISQGGGTEPAWNPDRQELFYRHQGFSSQGKMMAVNISTEPSFTAGNPRMLFEGRIPGLNVSGGSQLRCVRRRPALPDGKSARRVARRVTSGTLGALIVPAACSCIT